VLVKVSVDKAAKVRDNKRQIREEHVPGVGGKLVHEHGNHRNEEGVVYMDQARDKAEMAVVHGHSHHRQVAVVVGHNCIVARHIEVGNQEEGIQSIGPYLDDSACLLCIHPVEGMTEEVSEVAHLSQVDFVIFVYSFLRHGNPYMTRRRVDEEVDQ